jgi:hypothetical protein
VGREAIVIIFTDEDKGRWAIYPKPLYQDKNSTRVPDVGPVLSLCFFNYLIYIFRKDISKDCLREHIHKSLLSVHSVQSRVLCTLDSGDDQLICDLFLHKLLVFSEGRWVSME